VDPAVEAGKRRLVCRLEEGAEPPRREAALVVRAVDEGIAGPEDVGEDLAGGTRLHRVAGGVLGEGRRDEQRQPVRVELGADVRHRPEQVVAELPVPARDEGVRNGHPDTRVGLGGSGQAGALLPQHLRRDGDRVAGRCGRGAGVVRPEARDRGAVEHGGRDAPAEVVLEARLQQRDRVQLGGARGRDQASDVRRERGVGGDLPVVPARPACGRETVEPPNTVPSERWPGIAGTTAS
jgi:hypothetical protein